MVQQLHVYLFGDQMYDYNAKLCDLLCCKDNPILTAFLEQACCIIRTEIAQLPLGQRASFPKFTNLADLLAREREGDVNPAFQTALSCIYQLGCFIRKNGESGRAYPVPADTYLLGVCTGSLAAAAVSSCKSLLDLLPAAVQTVLVAFRLGLCVVDVGNRIEKISSAVWSIWVSGLLPDSASEALNEFSKFNRLPPTSRPWIGAHAANGTTVCGPPSILKGLRESATFAKFKIKDIPIRVPSHTSHLFTIDDVRLILKTTSDTAWASYTSEIPIISSATGKLMWAGNFRSLLQTALCEILMEPLHWDKINEELPLLLKSSGAVQVKIIPIATNAEHTLQSAMRHAVQKGEESTKYWPQSHKYWPSPEDLVTTTIEIDYQEGKNITQPQGIPYGRPELSKIAIVGMSGRFPDAESPEAFWSLLYQGIDAAKEVPSKRWNVKTHVDATGATRNTGSTPWGCWLNNPGLFDAQFFSISPKEAPQVDPAQRIALMTAYEAIEEAGIVPGTTPSTMTDRIGVFYGVTGNDYMETNTSQDIGTHFITGGNRAFIPGRINFYFEFCGPSCSVDTACSSSLAAIYMACNALWRGDIDTAVAGGTNMITNPDGHTGLDRGFFLSRTGNCKPFDDNADGYCRAEAVGTVILKRLEDALADKDPIQAVILAAKMNHSGDSNSITRPDVGAQRAIFENILNSTGVDPYDVSYVEMHGTGTQVGDAVEMQSVLDTFAPEGTYRGRRNKDKALYLGTAKANIGHGEGASGVTSLAKVLLMMRQGTIPPHCGIKPGSRINHRYPTNLDERNVHIALESTPWCRAEGKSRRVLINNFSAAGGNTTLLLEDAPVQLFNHSGEKDPRSSHIVAVSAKSATSLKGNLKSLQQYIERTQDLSLPQLSYTTTARRIHHQHRVIVSGSDITQVKTRLGEAFARGDSTRAKPTPGIVFAFTGQGSQYLGMGKQFFEAFSQFRSNIHRFDQLAQSQGFPTFQQIFVAGAGDIGEFTPLAIQLATTCMQMALARLLASWGITATAVVGHSLGEYAALNVAGVISDSETIYLVGKRAELLQERCKRGTHSMLAVHASFMAVESLFSSAGKKYEISCINGPEDTVLGGSNEQISSLQTTLTAHQLKTKIIQVPYAFHTSQVDPILETFEAIAHGVTFNKPSIPVICPLSAGIITEAGIFGPNYLRRHCRETVNMCGALQHAKEMQVMTDKTIVIEIGPHPVVTRMVKATLGPQITTFNTLQQDKDTWSLLTQMLSAFYSANANIKWQEYHRDFISSQKVLRLPAYSWNLKEYWIKYRNDWCLTKGDPTVIVDRKTTDVVQPSLETTTVHRLVEETVEGQKATIIVESDFSRTDLNSIAKGHKVNQIPLTTPSVYADIALTIGTYLLDRFKPEMKERLVDVSNLVVNKALIPHSEGPQLLRTSAQVDWTTKSADCIFYSVDERGQTTIKHALCTILFADRSQLQVVQQKAPEFFTRMDYLRQGIEPGRSLRLNSTQGYKLIGTLAQFHPDYRAIDEIILDSNTLEACSVMNFAQVKNGGVFHTHPAYIDVLTQTAGFVMNCKDSTDLDVEVYVNHGWKSFQVYAEISPKKTYRTYVKMAKAEGTIYEGDTVMFDGDTVVAFFRGVALRGLPRKVFHAGLTAGDTAKIQKALNNQSKNADVASLDRVAVSGSTTRTQPAMRDSKSSAPPIQKAPVSKPAVSASLAGVESRPGRSDKVISAFKIISEESGIAMADLTDDRAFADIGIDSLLSMVIASRFREELGLDLDVEFSPFADLPTVKHMREFLDPPELVPAETCDSEANHVVATGHVEDKVAIQTGNATETSDIFALAIQIIAEESGIAVPDLTDDRTFAEIGIDSLLSMVITSRFREELGLDLDLEFSIFVDLPTVKHLRQFIVGLGDSESDASKPDEESDSLVTLSSTVLSEPDPVKISLTDKQEAPTLHQDITPKVVRYCRPATSVILQGFPKTAQKTLFLLPDGGGSSSSYVPIPRLSIDAAIIGLNSPYLRDPQELNCSVGDLIDSYVAEMRRRQPHGPYNIGGWSSGGTLAYITAQKLVEVGEEVHTLIIIDSPVPRAMERLPDSFFEYCDTIGLFGHTTGESPSSAPPWLIPHFNMTTDILSEYRCRPMSAPSSGRMPRVAVIWACESVLDFDSGVSIPEMAQPPQGDRGSKGVHFLMERRTDFGPDGWQDLLPGAEVLVDKVVGANHFSMMQKPYVAQVARFFERALS